MHLKPEAKISAFSLRLPFASYVVTATRKFTWLHQPFFLKYNPQDQWAPSFYLGKGAAGSQKSLSVALMELPGTSLVNFFKEHSSLSTSRPSTSKLRRFATALQRTLMKMHSSFKTENTATGKCSSWGGQFNGTRDHCTPATCSVRGR